MSEHLVMGVGENHELWFELDNRTASDLAVNIVEALEKPGLALISNVRIFQDENEEWGDKNACVC